MKKALMVLLLLLLAGCSETLEDRVPDVSGEVLYHDVFSAGLPADQLRVFGVGLGDDLAFVEELHGPPDVVNEYKFGRLRNTEYFFGMNETVVLYHFEDGVVTGMLLDPAANPLLHGETVLRGDRAHYYSVLGLPSVLEDLKLERVLIYDSLGYEIYLVRNAVDRVYLTTPNLGRRGPGSPSNTSCGGPVFAQADDECVEFPNACLVPEDWELVEECDNQPPVVCIEDETSAVDPLSGACSVYESGCDVPRGYERVSECPDTEGMCAQVLTDASNPDTGTCVTFPTPCHVPSGWRLGCE